MAPYEIYKGGKLLENTSGFGQPNSTELPLSYHRHETVHTDKAPILSIPKIDSNVTIMNTISDTSISDSTVLPDTMKSTNSNESPELNDE